MEQDNQVYESPAQEPAWGEYVSQPKPEPQPYRIRYAEPVYEMPHGGVYYKPKAKKKRGGAGTVILSVFLSLTVALASCGVTAWMVNRNWQQRYDTLAMSMNEKFTAMQEKINAATGNAIVQPDGAAGTGLMTPGQVYAQNVDAVVAITSYVQKYGYYGQAETYESFGSGFIISEDGYVVSNCHVVEGAVEVEVTTSAGDTYKAVVVGQDTTNDIALLKMDAQGLPYAVLGSSSDLAVGEQVAAIGNPLGELTSTLTVGYVSAKDRVVTTDGSTINMIQTDAAINSGNSGGPLFNMKGEVVGITTAKYSGTSSSGATIEGIGFAIPMDDVIGMIEDLRDLGYVSGAYLGVMVRDVDPTAQNYGLPAGAFVEEVTPGFAAEAAGLMVQDIIVDLGGYQITSVSELTRMLRKFEPGETVSITVCRGGQELQLRITLDEKPREDASTQEQYLMPGDEGFEEWYQEFIEDYFG